MNKLFLIGIIAGLIGAFGLAAVFAMISSQGSAQMMGNFNGQTGPGMMYNRGGAASQTTAGYPWDDRAAFNANGISNVNHVQITGVSITGEHEVTVNLRYDANGTTPSITVIAASHPAAFRAMMYGSGYGQSMMLGYGAPMMYGYQGYNITQMQNLHNQMMGGRYGYPMMNPQFYNQSSPYYGHANIAQPGTGSSVLNSGWQSNTSVKVRLDGQGSAYDNFGVHVMVFPLTS